MSWPFCSHAAMLQDGTNAGCFCKQTSVASCRFPPQLYICPHKQDVLNILFSRLCLEELCNLQNM